MKMYRGAPKRGRHGGFLVRSHEAGDPYGRELHHHVRHSPSGFAWGYGGSGPAELARCLLIDALDLHDEAERSHGELHPFGDRDVDELVPPSMYQGFKRDFIATVPMNEPWVLEQSAIILWAEEWRRQHGKAAV